MKEKIYEDSFKATEKTLSLFGDFVAIVRQLRRDCPWDREQTHDSIKHLLIEEAYETLEAIDESDYQHLRKELGDLLLHVVFHSVIAAEANQFDVDAVIQSETDKLVRRHPHVFGDVKVGGVDDVLTNWESIKIREGEKTSVMEGIPNALPNLLKAFRIQEKAAGVGFDFPGADDAWEKVDEELDEFKSLLNDGVSVEEQENELGDLLFALVNYSRLRGLNPENALAQTNTKFIQRFKHIEQRLEDSGGSVLDATLEEMDGYWNEAKGGE